jgi:hypothetical protein
MWQMVSIWVHGLNKDWSWAMVTLVRTIEIDPAKRPSATELKSVLHQVRLTTAKPNLANYRTAKRVSVGSGCIRDNYSAGVTEGGD